MNCPIAGPDHSVHVTTEVTIEVTMLLPLHPDAFRVMPPQVTPQVTPQVEDAIMIFCEYPRSAAEIQAHMGFRDRKHFQTAYLRPMLEAGWLARTMPDKPNSRNQRYITTEKGKQHIQNLVTSL
jgi:ATP-dependent DNA helicase RecG